MSMLAQTWIARLLGAEDLETGGDARVELVWENLPSSWGVFVLIAGVVGIGWLVWCLYRREVVPDSPRGARWLRRFLALLRLGTLLTLLFIFLGPAIRLNRRDTLKPNVILLRDASASMAEVDSYQGDGDAARAAAVLGRRSSDLRATPVSRAELVNKVLAAEDHRLQNELSRLGNLHAFDFAQAVERIDRADEDATNGTDTVALEPLPPLDPRGTATDLHQALREGLSDKQAAAIVVFSDGQHTAPGDLAGIATEARARKVPLLVVGVGDPVPPRNLMVGDLYADPHVWKDDPFELQVTLRAEGVGQETVEVEFFEIVGQGEGAAETVLETRAVPLPADDGPVRLTFRHTPTEPGRRFYSVRTADLPNERRVDDNQSPAPAMVRVLDNEAKVLLVAGGPMWEYRNLQVLLTREKFIHVSCWLQSIDDGRAQAGNDSIQELPRSKKDLFEYDVIIMLDPDPSEFTPEWMALLKEFVREHAGGLLYLAGPRHAGDFLADASTRDLRDLLPVQLGDVEDLSVQAMLSINTQEWPLRPVSANADHPMLRFYADTEHNLERWRTLPGTYWSFPAEDAKPAAKTLLERRSVGAGRPLLVAGQYGSGRTAYLGFSGTWRWRPIGRDNEFYNSFWVQAVRWLVEGRAMEGRRRGTIDTEQDRYQVGERVQLTAQLKTEQYEPLEEESVKAALAVPGRDNEEIALKAVPNQPGRYQATLIAKAPGAHRLTLELPNREGDATRLEKDFSVTLPLVETRAVWLNKPVLRTLAEQSGGRYFEIDETAKLIDFVPDRTRVLETQGPANPLWDNWRLLAFLVFLLGLEWALRKRYKLL